MALFITVSSNPARTVTMGVLHHKKDFDASEIRIGKKGWRRAKFTEQGTRIGQLKSPNRVFIP